jgi:hypothetical protein
VKADDMKSNRLAEFSDYIEYRREMEGCKSVSFDSPNGTHTQPSEPVREKKRIKSMAHKRAGYANVRKNRGGAVSV